MPTGNLNKINQEFEHETRLLSITRIKIICFLSIPFFPAFGILDYFVAPKYFLFFLLFRLCSALIHSIVLFLCYTRLAEKYVYLLGTISALPMSFFISVMAHFTGGYTSTYYAGLNLMFLGFSLLMPWSLGRTIGVYVAIYLSYILPIGLYEEITNWPLFLNNNYFLLMTMIIASTATFFSYKLRFKEFKSRYELKEANDSIEEAKTNLENA